MPIWRDIVPIFYLKYWAFAWKITEFVEDDECFQRKIDWIAGEMARETRKSRMARGARQIQKW